VEQRHLALVERGGDPLGLPRSAGLEQGVSEETSCFDDLGGGERCRGNTMDSGGLGQRRPLPAGPVADEPDARAAAMNSS
jgi:hypothetical protein